MSSASVDPSDVDILLFSHPHNLAYQLLYAAADLQPSLSLLSPTAVPIPLATSAAFQPRLLVADVYPVPSHPRLSFSSLLYFHDASHSSSVALDTSRRHVVSILQDRPTIPVLVLLYADSCLTEADPQHVVDFDTLYSSLECDKLSNPVHILSFAHRSERDKQDAMLALQWLYDMLYPSTLSTPVRWSSSTSIAPLLTPHLPAELINLTLSYLSCSTRGAFLSEAEYAAQQTQLQRLREVTERKQQRKELLRFLSAYSHHHTRHQSEDDTAFTAAFTSSPAPFLYPNSSYAHLDLLRLVWHAMRQHGIRNGAAIGWQQMEALLDKEVCKRLLGHWAMECLPPIDRRPLNGADAVERWRRERRQAEDRIAATRRIYHTTRWACIVQQLANLIQHSHTTHPTHHHYALLPDQPTAGDSVLHANSETAVDAVPECWSSFASFLQNHPQLLTLAFVDEYYSGGRLNMYDSWLSVVRADKREMRYWLPVLQAQIQPERTELDEVSERVTRLEDSSDRLGRGCVRASLRLSASAFPFSSV